MNGEILSPADAMVSVFDRGFLYGDSVYEVLRTYGGRPFALDQHLDRLERSAEFIGIEPHWTRERLSEEIEATIRAAGCTEEGHETYVRLIITRGAGEIGLDPVLAENPLLVIIARQLSPPPQEFYRNGVEVAVVSVQRVSRAAVDPSAKTGNYLNNLLALKEARERGAYEALMLDGEGRITEGSTSNLFVVRRGAVSTPPTEAGILEGVTRRFVMRLAQEIGLRCEEAHLRRSDLQEADEAFLTSTIREILPITRCDGVPVGNGEVGEVTRGLQAAFRKKVGRPLHGGGF